MRVVWYRKAKKKTKWRRILPALVLFALLCSFYIRSIPPVTAILESQAQQLLSEMEHRIVSEVLSAEGKMVSNISLVERKEDGTISSVEVNTSVVNQIRNAVILQMNKELEEYASKGYRIPIGTLFGSIWTTERGPNIKFCIASANQSDSSIVSSLTSAGYNQTLHRVTLSIHITAFAVMPGYRQPIETDNEFVLAETVIVGTVPLYSSRVID